MEQEIFTEEIINKKELISELHEMANFLDSRIDTKNPADLNSFFSMVIDCIMARQRLLVKALMEELCAEKDIDYDAFMRDTYREKMNNIMSLIEDVLKKEGLFFYDYISENCRDSEKFNGYEVT